MSGVLRFADDGWMLEDNDGTEVLSGGYPLIEDDEFIQSAAELLDNWQYHEHPYEKIDDRS